MSEILQEIYAVILDKQTERIVSIDVTDRCLFTDFFLIGQCRSSRHLCTVCDALIGWAKMKKNPVRVQGRSEDTTWIVVDLGIAFIHLFLEDSRQIFDLESLWEKKSYTAQSTINPCLVTES